MTDILKTIDGMQKRFHKNLGDLNGPITQHEKHLTWMSSYYASLAHIETSSDTQSPYFSQEYNNHTFIIGYRIGLKERENEYARGYSEGKSDAEYRVRVAMGLGELDE